MPLEDSIPSIAELSGAEIPAKIGDYVCSVLFPRHPETGWQLLPPPGDPFKETGYYWGGKIVSVRGPAENIKCLGIGFPDEPLLDERAQWSIQIASLEWQSQLLDWLAVLHGEPAASTTIEPALGFLDEYAENTPIDQHEPGEFVSFVTWQKAIQRASNGMAAPLKFVLIHRATKAFYEGDYRVAVVDAATSVELAITQAVKERLSSVADAVLAQVRMLGARVDLARQLGLPIPSPLQDDLVSLRNDVVHRGVRPSNPQAARALKAATEAVSSLLTEDEINAD